MEAEEVAATEGQTAGSWAGLAFIVLGVSMTMLDTTVLNVALPWMAFDLGFSTSDTQWAVSAYALAMAAFLVVFGRLADVFGRRRVFIGGVLGFALSSVGVGLANTAVAVIACRAGQGLAAAAIMPSSLALINSGFGGARRPLAFAIWGSAVGGMAALGPLVGGWLTSDFSWRWAFWLNLPLAGYAALGAMANVKESRNPLREAPDLPGSALSVVAVAAFVFALIEGQAFGWLRPITSLSVAGVSPVPLAFAVSILALAGLIQVERHRALADKPVLFNLSLFAIASFRDGSIVALVVSLGEFGLLYALPLFIQGSLGYSAFDSGVLLVALAAGSFAASGLAVRLTARFGAVRLLQLGMLLEALAVAWVGLALSTSSTRASLAAPLFLYGVGIGFATAQLTGVILRDVPAAVSGQASALQSTARQVGAAVGTAVLGTTLAVVSAQSLSARALEIGATTEQARIYSDFITATAGQMIQFLILQPHGEQLVVAAHQALALATKSVAAVAVAFIVIGFVASLRLTNGREND